MKFNQKFYLVSAGKYENLIKNKCDINQSTEKTEEPLKVEESGESTEAINSLDQSSSINSTPASVIEPNRDLSSYSQNISPPSENKLSKPVTETELVGASKKRRSKTKSTPKTKSNLLFPPPGSPNFPDSSSEADEQPLKLKKSIKKITKHLPDSGSESDEQPLKLKKSIKK